MLVGICIKLPLYCVCIQYYFTVQISSIIVFSAQVKRNGYTHKDFDGGTISVFVFMRAFVVASSLVLSIKTDFLLLVQVLYPIKAHICGLSSH